MGGFGFLYGLFMLVIVAGMLVPGVMMLFYPKRAFTTATKPRWLGIPFLLLGLYFLYLAWPMLITS